MVGKSFPLSYRRKSFDVEELKKTSGRPLSGTIGKDLGFWPTCFLGFQTLGAIYGIHPPMAQRITDQAILGQVLSTYLLGKVP
jgi:hypothetical protein